MFFLTWQSKEHQPRSLDLLLLLKWHLLSIVELRRNFQRMTTFLRTSQYRWESEVNNSHRQLRSDTSSLQHLETAQ